MQTISNQELKTVKSYQLKKFRQQDQMFLAEGKKIVFDLLQSKISPKFIIISKDWEEKNDIAALEGLNLRLATPQQFKKISSQSNPDGILAVCPIPDIMNFVPQKEWAIALDHLQDPGNLGTIIRIADWFGISTIYCSFNTVDAYNPKVVQASMGSIARVNIIPADINSLSQTLNIPVYGATLSGESIYTLEDCSPGLILIGNESNGISDGLYQCITKEVTIPKKGNAESLNAGIATGILVSHLVK